MDKPFRKPEEMDAESTTAVTPRIKESTKETLRAEAKRVKKTASWLAGQILDDWAVWIQAQRKK